MLSVDETAVESAFFATNTVPAGEFSIAEFKRFVKLWGQRFRRSFPAHCAFWVMELTKKLTPHLHVIVTWVNGRPGAPLLTDFRAWNDAAWAEVVKSTHPMHRIVACNVQPVVKWGGASSYLSGYLKKSANQHADLETGRMWGVVNEEGLPVCWIGERLSREQGQYVVRCLRRHRQSKVIWLHSLSSHDTLRTQGKPRQWARLRFKEGMSFERQRIASEADLVGCYRSFGFRVRRVRPTCFRREKIKVWSEDEDSGKIENRSGADGSDYEIYSAASSWYYLPGGVVQRLIAAAKRLYPEGVSPC